MAYVDSLSRLAVDNSAALNSQKAPNFSAGLQAAQVKVSQSQTADMTIVTAEGDTVTLSSSKSAELSFATYNAEGQVGGASVGFSGTSAELHRSSAFSLSVDGDLNKEELKDIRRAIRTIQKAANDALKGHDEKAASRTAKLASLDQIASIDADLEFNQEVSVTRITAQSDTAKIPVSTETPVPATAPASESQQSEQSETVMPAKTWDSAETPATTTTVATATTGSHLSVLIQTQVGAPAAGESDTSTSGLWWLPSSDLWNTLHTKNDPLTDAVPAPDSTTPVTA